MSALDQPLNLNVYRTPLDVRPWRAAVVALGVLAAIELLLLVIASGALLGRSDTPSTPSTRQPATLAKSKAPVPVAALARTKVGVVVLNGNGRTGAAGSVADRVRARGYRIRAVGNAPAADYPRSIVMYKPGFAGEGQRLARDLGVTVVGPLDGMRAGQLAGAHTVVILGG